MVSELTAEASRRQGSDKEQVEKFIKLATADLAGDGNIEKDKWMKFFNQLGNR